MFDVHVIYETLKQNKKILITKEIVVLKSVRKPKVYLHDQGNCTKNLKNQLLWYDFKKQKIYTENTTFRNYKF